MNGDVQVKYSAINCGTCMYFFMPVGQKTHARDKSISLISHTNSTFMSNHNTATVLIAITDISVRLHLLNICAEQNIMAVACSNYEECSLLAQQQQQQHQRFRCIIVVLADEWKEYNCDKKPPIKKN